MINNTWTITQLVSYVKKQLSNDFYLNNITVIGEIGNFTNHFSGHWYFSLKDNTALIPCCMFKGYNQSVQFLPKNGDSVIVNGNVSVFERDGKLQLIVTQMKLSGVGDFYIQFEKTKQKLEPLGYFEPSHKKQIPFYPKQISVVTGTNTAALQDIKITLSKRWPVQLLEVAALVQGQEAIESIIKALKIADNQGSDVIILARGGGSIDDLWCFNDEQIAKTIFECKTPVITGIGHEIDTTIADLVADKRAATPTAAAVIATPILSEVKENIKTLKQILNNVYQNKINNAIQTKDYFISKLMNYTNILNKQKLYVNNSCNMLVLQLTRKIQDFKLFLNNNSKTRESFFQNKLNLSKNQFTKLASQLDMLSPLKTLSRGYIISKQNNKVIHSIKEIKKEDTINLTYVDGNIDVIVK